MMNTALARLRAKTDRELAVLIRREIQHSMSLAVRGQFAEAAQGTARAKAWLAVADLPPAERVRLEKVLEKVEASLEMPATACA
jgi:hypothetical protein